VSLVQFAEDHAGDEQATSQGAVSSNVVNISGRRALEIDWLNRACSGPVHMTSHNMSPHARDSGVLVRHHETVGDPHHHPPAPHHLSRGKPPSACRPAAAAGLDPRHRPSPSRRQPRPPRLLAEGEVGTANWRHVPSPFQPLAACQLASCRLASGASGVSPGSAAVVVRCDASVRPSSPHLPVLERESGAAAAALVGLGWAARRGARWRCQAVQVLARLRQMWVPLSCQAAVAGDDDAAQDLKDVQDILEVGPYPRRSSARSSPDRIRQGFRG